TLLSLQLTPPGATLRTGRTRQFYVSGVWSDSGRGAPPVSWAATGGAISNDGKYTAGSTPGTFQVLATEQGGTLADTAVVTITLLGPVLTGIVLGPLNATVQAGGSQQFRVAGVWSDGGTTAPAVTYSATGGTITSGGLYTAGLTEGTFWVIARQQGGTLADTTAVTVTAAARQLVGLQVAPDRATVLPGGRQEYQVQGIWTNGGRGVPSVTW